MNKVIGIGDSGIAVLNIIARRKNSRIETLAINSNAVSFRHSLADKNLLLNGSGFGTAGDPMLGRKAAQASKDMLFDTISGAKHVYITCGMGGGTGSGAAHVVAFVVRELRIPSTAFVSLPFGFEGSRRREIAALGIKALEHFVDELVVIDSEQEIQRLRIEAAPEGSEFAGMPGLADLYQTLDMLLAWHILGATGSGAVHVVALD